MSEHSHDFYCSGCGGTFESETPHDEAMAEAESLFGVGFDARGVESVCDDCWRRYVLDDPARVEQAREHTKKISQ